MELKNKPPRERIVYVASKLFHQQGYNATGINEIIEKAKVAKASFYQHFKSKENLALEYLEVRHKTWFEGLKRFTEEKTTPKEKVLSAFDYLEQMNEKENFRGCCFLNMLSEIQPDNVRILSVIQKHKTELQNFFIDIIGEENDAFIIYMFFEACMIDSQVYRTQNLIEKTKNNVKNLMK